MGTGLGIDVIYSLKKTRTQSPARRTISILITVVWLATVLQPCAMASAIDPGLSKVETHHTHHADDRSGQANDGNKSANHNCPHCDSSGHDVNHCKSETTKICDNEDTYVYSGSVKSADLYKFHDQHQSFELLGSSDDFIQIGQLANSETGKFPPPFQGPKLTDLFLVYLK
ncbi:MAG: hypothetical protein WBS20_07770 [Lysobacterales bacterium]